MLNLTSVHQIIHDNNCSIEFYARGFVMKELHARKEPCHSFSPDVLYFLFPQFLPGLLELLSSIFMPLLKFGILS